ncbi:MAG: hypothetical protein LBL74_02365, partial [Bacteroidales bacterium]|nr:hypothetical protein [Bacteroidales bacterium]
MKKVLGLDLGTNSIGWALIEQDFDKKEGQILGMGSWIIPTDPEMMGRFSSGLALSKANAGQAFTPTGKRTDYRGSRHLRERHLLRRERLHRILNVLGFLPEHYASQIDFDKHLGQFLDEKEPKIAWKEVWNEQKGKNDFEFLFQKSFGEMVEDFKVIYGDNFKIPYDWTIYYLRKKALTYKLEKEELAWLILNFNQKRGYYQLRGEEKEENPNKLVEFHSLKVVDVKADIAYKLILDNGMEYRRETSENLFEWKDRELRFAVTTYLESDGTPKKEENGTDKRSIYMLKENETVSKAKKGTKIEERLLKIVDVQEDKDKKKEEVWYALTLENGWVYRRSSKTPLFDWKDKVRDFIVTTDLNDDGTVKTDKDGADKRSFRAPGEDDWTLLKKKTEADIDKSQKTVGQYIYETLLENPSQKIRGKLVRTIERKFYKDELRQILKKQIELQPELFTTDLYNDCVRELYRSNETQQTILSKRDFLHLFLNDIIFYQRPLRSQKSSIGNCSLEYVIHKINKKDEKGKPIKNVFEKDVNGNDIKVKEYLKGIPKSNPYYQEFRIWQWLYNLKIYRKIDDTDVTTDFIKNTDDIVELFEFLMTKKEVNHKDILQYFLAKQGLKGKAILAEIAKYRWNYVFDDSKDKEEDKSKKYPCNTTGYEIIRRLEKIENVPENLLTPETEYQLWHIIYSVTDKIEFEKAIRTFATKRHSELVSESQNKEEITGQARNGGFVDSFVENFKKFPPFKSEYGSFSEKAIKKLLPLMRLGKYWSYEAIDEKTRERISKIITGEYDETIKTRLREKAINLTSENDFQGLQLWLAQYVVYNRHSEADNVGKWH